jgi:hypothetical protein
MAQAIAATTDHAAVAPYIASTTFSTPTGAISFNKDHAVDNTLVKVEIVKDGALVPLQ